MLGVAERIAACKSEERAERGRRRAYRWETLGDSYRGVKLLETCNTSNVSYWIDH